MKDEEIPGIGSPSEEFKHPSGVVGTKEEQSVIDLDEPNRVVYRVPDRFVADAMASSRPGDPHGCFVPHYRGHCGDDKATLNRLAAPGC